MRAVSDPGPAGTKPPRLDNMSCRPNVVVIHPSNDPTRQLVPALRIRVADRGARLFTRRQLLAAMGAASWSSSTRDADADAARRLDAISRAVPELLDLPSVLPVAGPGSLPVTTDRAEPLLAWALLARRSGPIWLARRPCAVSTPVSGSSAATLLVGPDLRDRILAAIDAPGWPGQVLERARAIERELIARESQARAAAR